MLGDIENSWFCPRLLMLGLLMPRYVADAEFGDAEVAFVAHNVFKRSVPAFCLSSQQSLLFSPQTILDS
jgi:hypothetical protein